MKPPAAAVAYTETGGGFGDAVEGAPKGAENGGIAENLPVEVGITVLLAGKTVLFLQELALFFAQTTLFFTKTSLVMEKTVLLAAVTVLFAPVIALFTAVTTLLAGVLPLFFPHPPRPVCATFPARRTPAPQPNGEFPCLPTKTAA